ncbi:MAG: TIGR02452 family protein [Anaerolineae bacterium]|nr:TIGR02452 family protein [Anaerolineae bacterium]
MLSILPPVDSTELANRWWRELGTPRHAAAELGRSAVEACSNGYYYRRDGCRVDWDHLVDAAIRTRVSIPPGASLPRSDPSGFPETRVQVRNETTLAAARRLVEEGKRPLVLNFANGVQPGGGFLNGARAQEEVLCRSSALFVTLHGDAMYAAHAGRPLPDSSDWAIYSPDVPVFRQDGGTELDQQWLSSFVTCAAPYAPRLGQRSGDLLQQRIHRVLAIAQAHGHTALVLGAWGCGAFGNDPRRTAVDFRDALENAFSGAFSDILFAITDWSPERRYLGPFRDVFAT